MQRDKHIEEQYQQRLKELKKTKKCPFCKPDPVTNVIVSVSRNFIVLENLYPYLNTKTHWLIITKEHYLDLTELPSPLKKEFFSLLEDMLYTNPKAQILLRGAEDKTRTVEHFHAHVIEYE